ncbi:MAG: tryptophan synthase subunit alpha [Deltaproteobacteria bacterium]|nr:tryptophan synthase subunit alpha [Deltaproteobacteria bacterium]
MKTLYRSERLKNVFDGLKKKKEKALIAFITAGDPDLGTTENLIYELEKRGVDIIELGIPFSDPMADGPTIQASSERALKAGVTVKDVIGLVKKVRMKVSLPIVLFGYYNPIFNYGLKRFARSANSAGVDAVLVVDLPPEESGELKEELDKQGIDLIFLLTPTSDKGRIRLVANMASGFIYYVSIAGVTGARKDLATDVESAVKGLKHHTGLPIAVGFGISNPDQVRTVARWADAVVVGSAIIDTIRRNLDRKDLIPSKIGEFVQTLKDAAG